MSKERNWDSLVIQIKQDSTKNMWKKFFFPADDDIGKCIFNHMDFVQQRRHFNEFPALTLKVLFFKQKKEWLFFFKAQINENIKNVFKILFYFFYYYLLIFCFKFQWSQRQRWNRLVAEIS